MDEEILGFACLLVVSEFIDACIFWEWFLNMFLPITVLGFCDVIVRFLPW